MDEMQKAKIKLSQTMAAADSEARRYEELVNKNQEFSKVVADKEKKIEVLDKETAKKQGDIVILGNELVDVQNKIEGSKKILSDLGIDISERQKELASVNEEISMAKSVQADAEASFKDKIDKERVKTQNELDSLESERQGLLDGNKTITEGNTRLEAKKLELDEEIKNKNTELEAMQEKINVADRSLINSEQKEKELLNNIQSNIKDRDILTEEIKNLATDKKDAEDKLKEVNDKLDDMISYRIDLIKKGKAINKTLEQIKEIYKSAGIDSKLNIDPIVVPSDDN